MPICVRKLFYLLTSITLLTSLAFSEGTRTWEQSKFEDLTKGTAKGVAIRSTGGLELAPSFKALATTPSTYIWSIAADPAGNLYAGAGSPARVYMITADGRSTPIFEPQELQVQALVISKSGVLYAATTPDGKVYRIEKSGSAKEAKSGSSEWSASVYFDPGTKYIWDLALDDSGNLYVATGDKGEIYRVTPNGQHAVFFKSDETHIRTLAIDPKGNVIAGSDGSGLVYRISPSGEGFVLYSAPKKEITALAIDKAGNIYAAGVGEKRGGAVPVVAPMIPVPTPTPAAAPTGGQPGIVITSVTPISGGISGFPGPGVGASGGSEIYRIAPDGSPDRIWTSREDLVYALAFDDRGHLLAGTGNRGHIFEIDGEDQFSDLLKASASQVTAFAKAPGGGLYASTSNLGKVFLLGASPEAEGTYESDVFDARIFSKWGRLDVRGNGKFDLYVRSGNVDNPDRNWSPWKQVDLSKETPPQTPSARYAQWKAVLFPGAPASAIDNVTIFYLPKNVAPEVDEVAVTVGARVVPGARNAPPAVDANGVEAGPPTVPDKHAIAVKWKAHDANDDDLVYSVYYRADGENRWKLLRDNVENRFVNLESDLFADGGYNILVVASDAPSHAREDSLTGEATSSRFEVDNTPPRIEALKASVENNQVHLTFRAVDSFSTISRAEYSIDADDWQIADPVGQISDDKVENYDFRVPIPASSAAPPKSPEGTASSVSKQKLDEHTIVIRVYDQFENVGISKTVVRTNLSVAPQ